MGENEGLVEPGGPLPNGLLPGAGSIMVPLDAERWLKAEERTAELIACIQPNQLSEERRIAVADYVQRLIIKCFPCQVCTFGSVPLKTYLPDGDIDLTAFCHDQILKETWANQVRDMLENEEKNENAEFHVKEVQYIQAEVKIVKCLVENIVVDISFNQVGGLCTLCFLEEVDNLINQNHLFKRSIILIKAWCYYESRILGAHHGLISTYALETLVLYIFHVFNNSFYGPLEVLYRFLEFFSNFDWANFCVSLWGPVPINSLPDVTAESPRKDGGELLLSKLFLDACSSVYAVFPGDQEKSGQPFVSKHFNVVDPLRVNNNLGRSVSKGNSFRIKSAFAFGAKRLARLLECPKENLVSEVNQFFMNTWERHGSGHRPDAPGADRMKLSTPNIFNESEIFKDYPSGKRVQENSSLIEMEMVDSHAHGVSREHGKISSRMRPEKGGLSVASHKWNVKSQFNLNSSRDGNQTGRDQVVHVNQVQKDLDDEPVINDIQGQFLFARTRSSPDLTDTYSNISSQSRHNRQAEMVNSYASPVWLESGNQRKNFVSESLARTTSRSSVEDATTVRHVPAQKGLDVPMESKSSSISYHRDLGLDSLSEDISSTSAAQLLQEEEQDIVNMMATASLQGINTQAHAPFNLMSTHLRFPFRPSFLASMGYDQRITPGLVPTNIPFIDPSFANLQFPHGLVSQQMAQYFHGMGITSHSEDSVERSTENFGSSEMNSREIGNNVWHEQDVVSARNFSSERKKLDTIQTDEELPELSSNLKYIPSSRSSGTGSATRVPLKHTREKCGSLQEISDRYHNHDGRSDEVYAEETSVSSSCLSAAHSTSLRNKTHSESSLEGSSVKTFKSSKEKLGKKILSADLPTKYGKGKTMSEHISNQGMDKDQDWDSPLNDETEMGEINPVSEQVASLQIPRHHLSGFEAAQSNGSDSMMPFAPMFISHNSKQGMNDNSGLLTFYPAGPPIPFVTMLPVYNIPSNTGASDASNGNFGGDESLDQSESELHYNLKGFDQSEKRSMNMVETSEEQKRDILSSDFASHWQNLQFGRLCQNPLVYPSPIVSPPIYLQGQPPYDNLGRALSSNTDIFSQLMTTYGNRLVPVAPLPSVSGRPQHLHQRYTDDIPRYRSGTGTYLPNPKISVRERHISGSRRGNFNLDRNDYYGDRESNWNQTSKSRNTGRNNRNQSDRSNSRTGQLALTESRADRLWASYTQDSASSYQAQNGPLPSISSQNSPQNLAYSMYPLAATNPNEVSNGLSGSPLVMLYPFDHNITYGSHGEPLEFGSLGPVTFAGINKQLQLNEGSDTGKFEESRRPGSSERRSSPDQLSSPHQHHRYWS